MLFRPVVSLLVLFVLTTSCGAAVGGATQATDEIESVEQVPVTEEIVSDVPVPSPEAPHIPDSAEHAEEIRATDGLLTLYDFEEGSGTDVLDSVGGHHLSIADLDAIDWVDGGLSLVSPTTVSNREAPKDLIDAITASGELSVEVWFETADLEQDGPARIVTISSNTELRNLTIGQGVHGGSGNFIDVRLRTTETDLNGTPSLAGPDGMLGTDLSHVVLVRRVDGTTALYVDGELQVTSSMGGDLSNWDEGYRLVLGNEATEDRPWIGVLHMVAIYDRALVDTEIVENFEVGPRSST